jgi:hypothetical protein
MLLGSRISRLVLFESAKARAAILYFSIVPVWVMKSDLQQAAADRDGYGMDPVIGLPTGVRWVSALSHIPSIKLVKLSV